MCASVVVWWSVVSMSTYEHGLPSLGGVRTLAPVYAHIAMYTAVAPWFSVERRVQRVKVS